VIDASTIKHEYPEAQRLKSDFGTYSTVEANAGTPGEVISPESRFEFVGGSAGGGGGGWADLAIRKPKLTR
jgi:hypothetical protein